MDNNEPMTPGWTNTLAGPPPPAVLWTPPPLKLRPIWIGFLLAGAQFAFIVFAVAGFGVASVPPIVVLSGFLVLAYYFMIIHRMIRVLETQPGWRVEYTPAGVIWRQFIPFYGIFFLYQWTRDIESYVNWRMGSSSKAGLLTFLGLFLGFILRFWDSSIGFVVIFASLYLIAVPLKRALSVAPPADGGAPGYEGSLNLR